MPDAVVVGAGPAGLAASWHLARHGVDHVVLERGRVGETWRSGRWDSFALNTPSWMNRLPGADDGPGPPDGFVPRDAWVAHLDDHVERCGLPVRRGVLVTGLEVRPDGTFLVRAAAPDPESIPARAVVVATGIQREPRVPALAAALPPHLRQLHTTEYRNAEALPSGAVLVVGGAQSGGQVTEDLLDAGRTVYLSTSRVPRAPRRIGGRDVMEWLVESGFFEQPLASLQDPALRFVPQPIISGVGPRGHTLSLQGLAERGARLTGHLGSVERGRLVFVDDLGANVRFADEQSAHFRRQVAAFLAARGLDGTLAHADDDPADRPHPRPGALHGPAVLDPAEAGISAVVWATGVGGEFAWLPRELRDEHGTPRHDGGIGALPGIVAVGFPWLRDRGSGIVYGMGRDAAAVVEHLTEHVLR